MSEDKTEGSEEERSAFYDAVQTRYKEIGNVLWQKEYDDAAPDESKELWSILTGLAAITVAMESTLNLLGKTGLVSKKVADALCVQYAAVVASTQTSMVDAATTASDDDSE